MEEFIKKLSEIRNCRIYNDSCSFEDGTSGAVVRLDNIKKLAVAGKEAGLFSGTEISGIKFCSMDSKNALALMSVFSYTSPVNHRGKPFTMGLGDRLGCATPGHIRAVRKYGVFPVLAQQSIRELNLTKRTFPDVLSAAAYGVFQSGYRDGYGADGDHLKTKEEIKYALDSGFTMITLDCSAHIDINVAKYGKEEIKSRYEALSSDIRKHYEEKYLNCDLPVVGKINSETLMSIVLMFGDAITHAETCWDYIKTFNKNVDFELSIDETLTSTDPAAHYIIAQELIDYGVILTSIAPHFCGEFEKGIDYIGNIEDFHREFIQHEEIAEHFGSYKLSVHSGSDKFSVFSIIGKETRGKFHIKTAGTSWLEAMRAVAIHDPDLYRKAHKFALAHQDEARKYYHVTTSPKDITNIDYQNDAYLPEYLNIACSRQAIHIAYGLLLQEEWFAKEFNSFMDSFEEGYYEVLDKHISKHLGLLTGKLL